LLETNETGFHCHKNNTKHQPQVAWWREFAILNPWI